MNQKRLIELALPDFTQENARAYFGDTLTSILGDSNPDKALIKSLECTRLGSTCSRQGQASSARSKTTVSNSSHRSLTASPSRTVSAGSRAISAVSTSAVSISDRASSRGNNVNSVPGHKTANLCTQFLWCRSGLTVWCVQNEALQEVGIDDHGFFHQANCYMVFQSDQANGTCSSSLYLWSGSHSCMIGYQMCKYKRNAHKADYNILIKFAEELDKYSGGMSFMSLEHEGYETSSFLRHFQDGIVVEAGKPRQNSRKTTRNVRRLYRVVGRSNPSARCTECSDKSATENDILILDGYPRMYVWVGQKTDYVRRVKAIRLAKKIRLRQRTCASHIVVVEQNDKQMSDAFLRKLNSSEQCELDVQETVLDEVRNYKPRLYKVNGERVLYDIPLAATQPLKQKYLTCQDTFLLDNGPSCPLYIWVGNGSVTDTLYNALQFAMNFKQHHNYPKRTAVCRVREGDEKVGFIRAFIDWKSRLKKTESAVKYYAVTNTDTSSHGIDDISHDDLFITGRGTFEIWQVNGETVDSVPVQQHGIFYNHRSYIIVKGQSTPKDQLVIYFWIGSKTNIIDQVQAMTIVLTMNSLLEHKATIIRVLDGKEPCHFFKTVKGNMIVCDGCILQGNIVASNSSINSNIEFFNNTLMFRVQESETECVKMSQVSPESTSLSSDAVYVIITLQISILWYGKKSSAHERECSKSLLAYLCPERLHDYDIILEGRESATFWSLVQQMGGYPKQLSVFKLPRNCPTLALCSRKLAIWSFTDIPDFSKQDLCETDIFILDTHDQIQLWIGSCVVDRDDQETLSNVIQSYIDVDPAGRTNSDLQVLLCHQGYEPSFFRKYFRMWDCLEYGGEVAYETARRQLRQENADINIDYQNYLTDK